MMTRVVAFAALVVLAIAGMAVCVFLLSRCVQLFPLLVLGYRNKDLSKVANCA